MSLSEEVQRTLNWKRNLAVLWLGVFLTCASYTCCIPFLPVYLQTELGVTQDRLNFWSGLAFAVSFFFSSIMAPYWGAWGDKVGQRKMAMRAGLGLSLAYYLGSVVQTAPQFFAVRAFTGIIAGFVPACMSLASSSLPHARLGWGMGLMQAGVFSGSILGPLLGGYVSSWFGMRTSFEIGSVSLLVCTLLLLLFVRDVPIAKTQRRARINLVRDLGMTLQNSSLLFVMFMFFMVQVCAQTIQPLVTIYVAELMGEAGNASVKMSGWVFSIAGIAGIIAAPFWGKLGQTRGYARTLFLVLVCAGAVNLCQVFVKNVWHFLGIQFVYGLFIAGAIPNVNSLMVETTEPSIRGKAFGLTTSANQFGGVVGPLLGALLGDFMSTRYVLMLTGAALLCGACYTYATRLRGQ